MSNTERGRRPVFRDDETVDRLESRLHNQQATLDMLRSDGTPETDLTVLTQDVDLLQRRVDELRDRASQEECVRDQSAEMEEKNSNTRAMQETDPVEQPEATLLQLLPVGPALCTETEDNPAAARLARLEAEAEARRQSQGWFALAGCGVGAATAGIATAAPELAAGVVAAATPVVTSATATVAAAVAAAPIAAAAAVTIPAVAGITVVANSTRTPEHWVPDSHRTTCAGCDAEFGMVTRKHHCRGCGEVFCNQCAPPRPQSGERACTKCGAAVDAQLSGATSSADDG